MPWKEILDLAPTWMLRVAAVGAVALVAIQMWRGDAIVCPNGAVFAKSCDPAPIVITDAPDHAVVAFNLVECPVGWLEYRKAAGRFIVGAGRHTVHDMYGVMLTAFQLGEEGGSRTHMLTESELPEHTHGYIFSTGRRSPGHPDRTADEFGAKDTDRPTDPTGGNEPHNNMPPFVALRICEKSEP